MTNCAVPDEVPIEASPPAAPSAGNGAIDDVADTVALARLMVTAYELCFGALVC